MSILNALTPDLLAHICSFCRADDNRALLSLAITSRALSVAALRTLWCSLASPSPLFLALPESSTHWPARKYPARPSFSHSDLERFYHYASLVQSLRVEDTSSKICGFSVSSEMWTLLKRANSEPIFPNLRHVTICEYWDNYVLGPFPIYPFLSPSVEDLAIILHCPKKQGPDHPAAVFELKDLLTNLALICPHLRKLNITTAPLPVYFHDVITHVVQGLSNLTSFQSEGITLPPMGVSALSSLSNLAFVKMSVRAADYSVHRMAQSRPSTVSFPVLQGLDITADTAECVVVVLGWSVVDPPRLTQLSVQATLTPNDTPAQFLSLTTAISRMHCRCTLERVTLHTDIPWIGGNNPCVDDLPSFTVAPLHDLSRLTYLRIRGYSHVIFDDAALAKMARAWPRLTVLSVCEQNLKSAANGVTLVGLRDLALQCPALVELDIGVASIKRGHCEEVLARPPHTRAECDGDTLGPPEARRLSVMNIGAPGLSAEDVAATAAALNAIFPYIERLSSRVDALAPAFVLEKRHDDKHGPNTYKDRFTYIICLGSLGLVPVYGRKSGSMA
ncbi:uncharacterized protein TRAVEDRAFT_16072 [Trametes versicolor FP-101664 SS1]|uniref:uncharacterized protein n=1 Tax=Trametes versicolor (strain FP-101664) TaxID=717944 RepID=UPI000462151F|nr:uncharacterized protein TRAVEDRAFT_16072 [Trametes versicolor FP-101664 SS1]EIW63781.1 hypothetical protein TRAVEDRAFT_16072 [Trametes versicolor FP-101664 SS1]